jgi:ABC-type antimicrobial peptide transport system permease subunit
MPETSYTFAKQDSGGLKIEVSSKTIGSTMLAALVGLRVRASETTLDSVLDSVLGSALLALSTLLCAVLATSRSDLRVAIAVRIMVPLVVVVAVAVATDDGAKDEIVGSFATDSTGVSTA